MDYSIKQYILWVLLERIVPLIIINSLFGIILYCLLKVIPPYKKNNDMYDENMKIKLFDGEYNE